MKSRHNSQRKAFTLIELLVVIAIIAILAAILFPVFASAREKARQTSCASNEKQLGLAFQQYLQDYDECYPYGDGCTGGWAGPIYSYVKSKAAFTCPDDQTVADTKDVAGAAVISYAISDGLMPDGNGGCSNGSHASASQLTAPSMTIVLFEISNEYDQNVANPAIDSGTSGTMDTLFYEYNGMGWPNSGWPPHSFYATGNPPGQTLSLIPQGAYHTGGANYLAADGHVKYLLPTKISPGKNAYQGNSNAVQQVCGGSTCAAGTASMDNGGGHGSATLTFSIK